MGTELVNRYRGTRRGKTASANASWVSGTGGPVIEKG